MFRWFIAKNHIPDEGPDKSDQPQDQKGLTPADPMGVTVRRISGAGGDRLLVRSRFTYDPSLHITERRLRSVGATHDQQFRRRFPMLGDLGMQYRWAGHLCLSINGVSAFGEVDDGLYAACCQNGLGVARGTLSGVAAAELVCRMPSPRVDFLIDQESPGRLPPEPLAWLGVNGVLRYKEMRAGRE